MAVNQGAEKPEDEDEGFVDELKPGTQLLQGQYTITKFINSGGFGITYLAKDSLDRDVVIKECFPGAFCRRSNTIVGARSRAHQNEFKSIVKLFVQEAKSQSKLSHPNIVGVHQVFEDNDTAYMAIDFINGRDLLEIIDDDKVVITPDNIVSMLRKLLGAVGFVHERGVLHRDISPDNVLVNKAGEPILIDFGAAREQASTKSRALSALRVVKDGYSPQEFYIAGSSQNDSSDLYALAATFYHAITGEAPPNSQARLASIAESGVDIYEPLTGRFEGYPERFLPALDKAISVLPKDRIKSAQEWLDVLDGKVTEDKTDKPVEASIARLLADEKGGKATPAAKAASKTEAPKAASQVKASLSPEPKKKSMGMLLGSVAVVAIIAGVAFMQFAPGDDAVTPTTPVATATPDVETAPVVQEVDTAPVTEETETANVVISPEPEVVTPEVVEEQAEAVTTPETPVVEETETPSETIVEEETAAVESPVATEEAAIEEQAPVEEPTIVVEEQAPVEEPVVQEDVATADPEVTEPVEEPEVAPENEPIVFDMSGGLSIQPEDPVAESVGDQVAENTATQENVATPQNSSTSQSDDGDFIIFGQPAEQNNNALVQQPTGSGDIAFDQLQSAEWDISVPFQTQQGQTENGEFPIITNVDRSASSIPDGEWINEGVVIYAINGDWVTGGVTIEELLLRSPDLGQQQFIYADVRLKASEGAPFEHNTLAIAASRDLVLKNGISFEISFIDGQWRTVVSDVANASITDFEEGDVVASEASTGRELTTAQSLEFLLSRLARDGMTDAEFTVDRNGFETTARMLLAEEG
ncbi:serine/threonine protein kinase [Parasulfitobacter algicola]|uniref:Protein kinase n=1 Tax=Parasulfitobacter algicola TaxID=2614809 RepID=A0ABX2IKV6_9RHOB|nr:serine/threonine-protein kinase [Sulfitobacter algicola]NSX53478.1 protein kinase [Sulfitobacter algicola]